jgi:hypothetical protein
MGYLVGVGGGVVSVCLKKYLSLYLIGLGRRAVALICRVQSHRVTHLRTGHCMQERSKE